jgi:hypothetical protein
MEHRRLLVAGLSRGSARQERALGVAFGALMRRLGWLILLVSGACVAAPAKAPSPQGAALATAPATHAAGGARKAHPVLVAIVVDQLAAWIASERWPELPAHGGFAQLIHGGTWVKAMRYAHAATDTAPGHSSLFTAVTPRESGIFANEVPDGKGGRLSILQDEATQLVTEKGVESGAGASLAKLRVDTLADRLHAREPDAVVLGLSLKDRGALFGAGRSPRAALWFDPKRSRFVTSTAFARALPSWALPVASSAEIGTIEIQAWNLLEPGWVKAHAKTPDNQRGEGDEGGFGVVFPHQVWVANQPGYALRTSPFGDDVLFALALAGIDGEKVAEHGGLVTISLSANDYVGHVFGPDSWEAWDELLQLDRSLARFLGALDARFGQDGYAVLLTADHGVTTMPEATLVPGVRSWCEKGAPKDPWDRACGSVGRLFAQSLTGELREASNKALGKGDWIVGVVDPYVYLTPAAKALDARKRALLDAAVIGALKAHPEVNEVTPTSSLPPECPPENDDSIAALVCRSVVRGDGGDYYVVPSRGSFFDPDVVVGKGSSHGSPYLFDRTVPLLARAPGRIPSGIVMESPVGFETFARAAAELLGIEAPGHAALGAAMVSAPVTEASKRAAGGATD